MARSITHGRIASILRAAGFSAAKFSDDPDENRVETVRAGFATSDKRHGFRVDYFSVGEGYSPTDAQRKTKIARVDRIGKALARSGIPVTVSRSGMSLAVRAAAPVAQRVKPSGAPVGLTDAQESRLVRLLDEAMVLNIAELLTQAAGMEREVKCVAAMKVITDYTGNMSDDFVNMARSFSFDAEKKLSMAKATREYVRQFFEE